MEINKKRHREKFIREAYLRKITPIRIEEGLNPELTNKLIHELEMLEIDLYSRF